MALYELSGCAEAAISGLRYLIDLSEAVLVVELGAWLSCASLPYPTGVASEP